MACRLNGAPFILSIQDTSPGSTALAWLWLNAVVRSSKELADGPSIDVTTPD